MCGSGGSWGKWKWRGGRGGVWNCIYYLCGWSGPELEMEVEMEMEMERERGFAGEARMHALQLERASGINQFDTHVKPYSPLQMNKAKRSGSSLEREKMSVGNANRGEERVCLQQQ